MVWINWLLLNLRYTFSLEYYGCLLAHFYNLFKNSYHFYNVSLQVGEMKKELVDLQPKLEQAKIENTNMMKVNTHLKSAS